MKTGNGNLFSTIQQTINNSTGWIGHLPGDKKEIIKGQTFVAEQEGDLESIEILTNMITDNGSVKMSLHTFDALENSWGPELDATILKVNAKDTGKWIAFNMHGLHLDRGKTYGFKMESDNGCIGVAEAAWSASQPPINKGQEWSFTDKGIGNAFSYYSLAFKVDVRA